MPWLEFEIDASGVDKAERFLKALGPAAEKGVRRALDRAVKGVRTDAVREVRKEYNVTAKAVRDSFIVLRPGRRASSEFSVNAVFRGNRIKLLAFGARPAKIGGRKPRKGISVMVKRSRKTVLSSFLAAMKSGHVGVFRRTGKFGRNGNKKLEHIEELTGPAVPQMVGNMEIVDKLHDGAMERFDKNLNREINFAINKF